MYKSLCFIILFAVLSCGNKKNYKIAANGILSVNVVNETNYDSFLSKREILLPDMCDLVSIEELEGILGLESGALTPKNSFSEGTNPDHKTCFFKWDDDNFPNSGIMLQAMQNPMKADFPEYIDRFIESKRTQGENDLNGIAHVFKNMQGFGSDGVYNTDIGKYYWRYSDKVLFCLAFNSIHVHEEQIDLAMQISSLMHNNFIKS